MIDCTGMSKRYTYAHAQVASASIADLNLGK